MKSTKKPPLYRKFSKSWSLMAHDSPRNNRFRYGRHTKRQELEIEAGRTAIKRSAHRGRSPRFYDYTPLYMFLLSKDGCPWEEVWKEVCERLDTMDPVMDMVLNITIKGNVVEKFPNWYDRYSKRGLFDKDWQGNDATQSYILINGTKYDKSFMYCHNMFSTMLVDEEGILRIIDPTFVPKSYNDLYTYSFNGENVYSDL